MKYLVAGNYAKFAVTLTQKSGELIMPYVPTEGDVVQISLYGARRFDYPNFEQAQNVLTFEDNGCLQVGLYCLEVKITEANTHRLRCMYREQIRVVASNDDVPTDASFADDDVQLSGQFDIVASTEIVVDDELSLTSTNPVQNKVVTAALNTKGDALASQHTAVGYEVVLKKGNTDLSAIYIPFADAQDSGLMTSSDYTKLAGVESGANKTLFDGAPTQGSAKAVTSGGMFDYYRGAIFAFDYTPTAENWEVVFLDKENNERLLITFDCADAEEGIAGLMSLADKTKLDTLPTNTDLQTALNAKGGTLAGDMTAAGYEIDLKSGNTSLSQVYVPFATAQADGLMSAADYSKLAGIATGATRVIVDTAFDITSNNAISNGAVATALNSKENRVAVETPVNTTDAALPITALNTDTGKYYRIDVAVETLAITLPAMTDSTKIANVVLYLTGGTTPAVTIASTAPSGGTAPDVYYQDGFAIETGKTYEVNCLWNGAAWIVAAVEIVIS